MTTLEYNIGEVAGFLRDLQEEKFPKCERWDESDCNCYHCRIEHFACLADKAVKEAAGEEEYQICNKCGRKTWARREFNNICGMTQPDNKKCVGLFSKERES